MSEVELTGGAAGSEQEFTAAVPQASTKELLYSRRVRAVAAGCRAPVRGFFGSAKLFGVAELAFSGGRNEFGGRGLRLRR